MPMIYIPKSGVFGAYLDDDGQWVVDSQGRYIPNGKYFDNFDTLCVIPGSQGTVVETGFCASCEQIVWKEADSALCAKCL